MSMFSRLSSKMFGEADANQRSTPALPAKYDEFTTTSVSTDEPASADDISTGAESADTFAHEPSADLEMTAEEPPCDSEGQAVEDSAANEGEDMAGGESLEGDEAGEQLNEGGWSMNRMNSLGKMTALRASSSQRKVATAVEATETRISQNLHHIRRMPSNCGERENVTEKTRKVTGSKARRRRTATGPPKSERNRSALWEKRLRTSAKSSS